MSEKPVALLSVVILACTMPVWAQAPAPTLKSPTPLTIIYAERASSDRDGPGQGMETHRLLAVRADGAQAQRVLPSGRNYSGYEIRMVELPAERKIVRVIDALRLTSTEYYPEQAANWRRQVRVNALCTPGPQLGSPAQLIGEETILGYRTLHYLDRFAGEGTSEEWLAPDLDCRPLKVALRLPNWGGQTTYNTKQALEVKLGEPDPREFALSLVYTETAPSGLMQGTHRALKGEAMTDSQLWRTGSILDKKYQESQQFKPTASQP